MYRDAIVKTTVYRIEILRSDSAILSLFHHKQIRLPTLTSRGAKVENPFMKLVSRDGGSIAVESVTDVFGNIEDQIDTLLYLNSMDESPGILAELPFHPHHIPPIVRGMARRFWPKARIDSDSYTAFPNWPIEYSIDFLGVLQLFDANQPDKLPNHVRVCLSHDVDTKAGQINARRLARVEESLGFRSAWFLVPGNYKIDRVFWSEMRDRGHEIGCHGWVHDFKLATLPAGAMSARIEHALDELSEFEVKGFRSPGFYRSRALMEMVGRYFEYDSSIPDTLCLPGPGGCGTVFPKTIAGVKQVPVTVPWDGELMALGLSRQLREKIWWEKIDWIGNLGGLVHLLTHPDPGFTHAQSEIDFYHETLEKLRRFDSRQHLLPWQVVQFY